MADLPNPLTPADCDLTGYRWMPLDVIRVIDSDTFGISTGDEFKTAFRLWAKCWQQVPAASLPDDDRVLAHLAGLSENLPKWRKVRDVALRGFVKCNDGRLYHPVIAEKAIEAMGKREQHVEREENEQTRQQRLRARRKTMFEQLRAHGIVPAYNTKTDELERLIETLPVTESVTPVTQSVTGVTSPSVTRDAPATAIEKDIDQTRTVNPVVGADAGGEPRATVRPSELSAVMRQHSIEASPHDPRIIAAAQRGIAPETMAAACVEARASDPNGRIKPGYVIAIAERWTAEASRPPRAPRANGHAESRDAFNERENARAKALLFGPEV
ncbi:YdaU family protein [Burkholderia sp. EMB26]|uniref:YdaU family protein n=1 Tax=Burkholderia sp. EMB26 TaxID=2854261 RepID=UPI00215A75A8|nr:YdaU family protein [Burkholderia sp. EMB26]UVE55288.1 YdaU family protein [Burkholderia sp. EMB26]